MEGFLIEKVFNVSMTESICVREGGAAAEQKEESFWRNRNRMRTEIKEFFKSLKKQHLDQLGKKRKKGEKSEEKKKKKFNVNKFLKGKIQKMQKEVYLQNNFTEKSSIRYQVSGLKKGWKVSQNESTKLVSPKLIVSRLSVKKGN